MSIPPIKLPFIIVRSIRTFAHIIMVFDNINIIKAAQWYAIQVSDTTMLPRVQMPAQ